MIGILVTISHLETTYVIIEVTINSQFCLLEVK